MSGFEVFVIDFLCLNLNLKTDKTPVLQQATLSTHITNFFKKMNLFTGFEQKDHSLENTMMTIFKLFYLRFPINLHHVEYMA